jgi:hypothetical protein
MITAARVMKASWMSSRISQRMRRRQRLRAPTGPAAPPPNRRDAPQQRHELRDVVAVAPVRDRASGMPWPSAITWCLEAVLPRPAGLGPVSGRPSAPARGNCRSPPWTSPACPRHATRPAEVPGPTQRQIVSELGDVLHDFPVFLTAPLYRRWHLRWGATPTEAAASLPGDALLPRAQYKSTRAITIDAPPDAVWPWLVQVGCQRAGFYSNDLSLGSNGPNPRASPGS